MSQGKTREPDKPSRPRHISWQRFRWGGEPKKLLFDAKGEDVQTLTTVIGWRIGPYRKLFLSDNSTIERVRVINASKTDWPSNIKHYFDQVNNLDSTVYNQYAVNFLHERINQSLTVVVHKNYVGKIEVLPNDTNNEGFEKIDIKITLEEYESNRGKIEKEKENATDSLDKIIDGTLNKSIAPRLESLFFETAVMTAYIKAKVATKSDINDLDLKMATKSDINDLKEAIIKEVSQLLRNQTR